MNKTYRNIWNAATNTWTAVAETAKSHSKGASSPRSMAGRACLTAVAAIAGLLLAQPAAATATQYGDNAAANGAAWGFNTNMGARRTDNLGFTSDMYGSNPFATAYGDYASASAQGAVAMGSHATSSGIGGMAVGTYATAVGRMGMALGTGAYSTGLQALGIGSFSAANGLRTTAIGTLATSNGADATAIGTSSNASGQRSIAIGAAKTDLTNGAGTETGQNTTDNTVASGNDSIAFGTGTRASADRAMAFGSGASATTGDGVALGSNSVANRAAGQGGSGLAAISVGSAGATRQIINVAAGTQDTDAVNFGQMNAGLSTTNASIAATNAALSTTNATLSTTSAALSTTNVTLSTTNANLSTTTAELSTTNSTLSTTNFQLAGLDSDMKTAKGNIETINDQLAGLSAGTIGLVQQSAAGADLTVGANTDGGAVNFAGTAGNRKLTGIAAGDVSAASSEAVSGSQLHGVADSVASAIGGGSTVNPDGSISAPAFTVGDGSGGTKIVNSVGDVVTNIDGRVTNNEGKITDLAEQIGSGTVGLVQQSAAGADLTVGANTDGGAVNFAGTAGNRKLTGIAAGDVSAASSEAVNGSQLHGVADSVASAIGGGSTVNPDGSISAPAFTVGDGSGGTKVVNSVGDVVTNLDGRTTINEGDIKKLADDIGSGTMGLVQQANPGDDITVGANTDGAAVNFSGKTGTRKLTGITAGDITAASSDAVNGSQLHGVANSVASAIGGGSTVNADGSISAPTFTVGDGSGGTKIVNSVGDVVTNLDGRTTTNEGNIKKLADDIGSGMMGLVQQANPGDDITVGANTDGAAVNFSGKTGTRKLTGITAGDITAASSDAVNGSQLHGVADSVASAIGGGSTVNADGSISAPVFTVGDGSGGTKIVNSVGDVVTNLNDRVTHNEGGIKDLADQLGSGTVGLVRQDATTGMITVGSGGAGSVVNFAGSGGPRVLSGVANGVGDDDVVTVSQLRATGLIDYTGKEVGAVTYDSGLSFDSVTFAGTDGTVLKRVAAGFVGRDSMEAVNGGQLYALQEEFAKQYGDLSGRFDDLSSRVGELETNPTPGDPGTGGPGAGGPGTGEGSTVVGEGANASGKNSSAIGNGSVASGENSSAVGQGSVASGKNSSAVGQGAVASGKNSSAVGQGAVASGDNSSAIGQGAVASGSNSVAIGQGSVAADANTVSFGDGTEAGNRRIVNIADGINASDAATKGQLDRAMESVDQRFNDTNRAINDVAKNAYAGIAAAMAMPNMTPSQPGKTVVAVGAANFKSGSAIAAGATYRSRNGNWLVNGATSVTSVGDVGIRAQVGYEF
nr:ESPR-type extended signal peptide-containing protein [Burkholderia cenocepacia]